MIASPHFESPVVGVVGSGTMGVGIAHVIARSGYEVVLRARSSASAGAACDRLRAALERDVARGKLDRDDLAATLRRVRTTTKLGDLGECGLVIESAVEDLAVKQQLFTELDTIVDGKTILTSNTSTFPLIDLAVATGRPDRVCGMHFFNPAPAMSLVEVARPLTASDATMATVLAFAESLGKQAIVVEDRAGFVVNALLFAYLNSAIRMCERGTATVDAIDVAMRGGCNFPMGPFALLDLVGLDTALAILDALYDEFRDPAYAACPTLRRKVSAGQLGRKSGTGFFTYGAPVAV